MVGKLENLGTVPLKIALETLGLEDEFPLWEGILAGAILIFGGVNYQNP